MAEELVWQDRKRILFGLPWTFTKYTLTQEKLLVESGIFNKREEEVRLYRILDVSLRRPLGQRLFGLGTIHCCTADKSAPELDILQVKDPARVKNLLSDMVEAQRMAKRVAGREFFGEEDDNCDRDLL